MCIRDRDLVVAVEHFENFGALLHTDGDILNDCIGIDVQTVFLRQRENLFERVLLLQEAHFVRLNAANKDILMKFEALIDDYFQSDKPQTEGLTSVKYFADKVFLSSHYFGDLVKKETGKTAQEYIQNKSIDLAKEMRCV